jgi:hypothetical protein
MFLTPMQITRHTTHATLPTDWTKYLPFPVTETTSIRERTRLVAIERSLADSGQAVRLKNHGSCVIEIPGVKIDEILVIAETAFSNEVLLDVIRSWADLVEKPFREYKEETIDRSASSLAVAFRRTLCANTKDDFSDPKGYESGDISEYDHKQIADWFLQGVDPRTVPHKSWTKLFEDMADASPYFPTPVSQPIEAAIRSATIRRTFFITKGGYIGLGPTKTRPGDYLYVLLGGHTPFVLRKSWYRSVIRYNHKVAKQCYEMIGDCYVDGLMNGEAKLKWKTLTDNASTTDLPRIYKLLDTT